MKGILLGGVAAFLFVGSAQAGSVAVTTDTHHDDAVVTPAPDATAPVDPDTTNSTTIVKKHIHPNGDTTTVVKKKHHDDDSNGAVVIHHDDDDDGD